MQKYNFLDFGNVLDSFITKELNRTSLKDNYATQIVIFLIYIPTLLGVIAFLFDFSTLFYMINQTINNWVLGLILGVIVGLIGAGIIFLSISLGTLRSAKNLRIFFVDFIQDAKTHKWAILNYTPKLKNLFYSILVGAISVLGLKGTLYLSTHAKILVTAFVKKPSAAEVQTGLDEIREKEESNSKRKTDEIKRKISNLDARLKSKINANQDAVNALNRLKSAVSDSLKGVSKQWETINFKQIAIDKKSVSSDIATKYKEDINYRKSKILPPIERKHHRRIEQKRKAYRLAISENLEWYDNQLSILNKKEQNLRNESDSTTNWLTNLYKSDINTQIANIDFLAFFAAGGNRYINMFVFVAFLVLGFFAIPDFGDYKGVISAKSTKSAQTHKETHKNTQIEYVLYNGKKTKASQVRTWIKTYTQRIEENTKVLKKLEQFANDETISNNEKSTAKKKIKTVKARIERTKAQIKVYQDALKTPY